MHEALIKNVVKCKMHMASKLLERLPPEASKHIRAYGKLIYEAVGDCISGNTSEPAPQVKNVDIQ